MTAAAAASTAAGARRTLLRFVHLEVAAVEILAVHGEGVPVGQRADRVAGEQLPEIVQGVSSIVPIARSLNVIRGSLLLGKGLGELAPDLLWLAGITLVAVPGGLLFSRVAIRRAKMEGTLVQY